MPKVSYGGQSYDCTGKTVLESLTAQGVEVPSSCRSGLCQTCLMRALKGRVPPRAQASLTPALAEQNYFLACVCQPEEDIEVVLAAHALNKVHAMVTGVERLCADVLGLRLKPVGEFPYRAGQFINFYKDEHTVRCYSLASVPGLDAELLLHVRKVPGGQVSNWMFEQLKTGDSVTISEAAGDCYYTPGKPAQNLLLVGTGTGLAPLYGIIRDALRNGHSGRIALYHGSYNAEGLYLVDELRKLAGAHPNFSYMPCVSEGEAQAGYAQGMVLDVALKENASLSGWRVYLCGNPDMVKSAQQKTFLAGASLSEIFADPFG